MRTVQKRLNPTVVGNETAENSFRLIYAVHPGVHPFREQGRNIVRDPRKIIFFMLSYS